MSDHSKKKTVVICGAGIIGCATAYYLTLLDNEKNFDVIVIERESVACHSSGKAGGFLALDWNDHSSVGPLARLSYSLHQELNAQLNSDIGYRHLTTYSTSVKPFHPSVSHESGHKVSWLKNGIVCGKKVIGTPDTTAQVHPYLLTNALMQEAISRGATLKTGTVIGIEHEEVQIKQIRLANAPSIRADLVVIAMGAWSSKAADFFPLSKTSLSSISGSRAHSLILEADVPAEALFTSYTDKNGRSKEPEIYPRPDGTVYICGEGDGASLPDDPKDVQPRPGACDKLQEMASNMSEVLENAPVKHQQACYLPCSGDGIPLIGKLPHYEGAFVATGHGCWGILNGPATGKCLAQLILDVTPDIDLTAFSPQRFSRRQHK